MKETETITIHEQGGGHWPAYAVTEDYQQAWEIGKTVSPIRIGAPGEPNQCTARLGKAVNPQDIDDGELIEIVCSDSVPHP